MIFKICVPSRLFLCYNSLKMDEVSLIREKLDIVEFIQEFIPLKKTGGNFKTNCPFHNEKSPSFMVNPQRQIWHCFGCGKGGDIYSFLMEYERLEFPEALSFLAKRAGIELVKKSRSFSSSKKEKYYEINRLALEYYHYILLHHKAGDIGRKYLLNRGLTDKIINTFNIGFAPPSGNSLSQYLISKKGFSLQDILDVGLANKFGSKPKDFFRDRIVFPLIDHRGNCVGFSGRVLDPLAKTSKYINTRETLIYNKSQHLFGLNITKDAIRRANQVILCEGEFDVISCFQNGIANVVGVKGTALTQEQVNLLARFAAKITFCFDGDSAGQEAIKRSLPLVEKKGINPTVIVIPTGKDPDEALQKDSGNFKKATRSDESAYDYLLTKLAKEQDPSLAESKRQISETMLPLISSINNEIIKEHYLKKTAQLLNTSYESVSKEIQRYTNKQSQVVNPDPAQIKNKVSKEEALEEYLLSLIVQSENPKILLNKALDILKDILSKDRARQKVLYHLLEHLSVNETLNGHQFVSSLPSELVTSFDNSLLFPLPVFTNFEQQAQELEKVTYSLRALYLQNKLKYLSKEINSKEKNSSQTEIIALKQKYSHLAALLKNTHTKN